MKTLKNHIFERLKINKNYKNVHFIAVEPKSTGTCLAVYIPLKANDIMSRIQIHTYDYENIGHNKVTLFNRANDIIAKNEKSYYSSSCRRYNVWATVLLFNEDALEFLNMLLTDNTEYFDVIDFMDDKYIKYLQKESYQCAGLDKKYYDNETIKSFISEIK